MRTNALAESFFATLECELLDRNRFHTQVEASHGGLPVDSRAARLHSGLGYLSSVDFGRRARLATRVDSNVSERNEHMTLGEDRTRSAPARFERLEGKKDWGLYRFLPEQ